MAHYSEELEGGLWLVFARILPLNLPRLGLEVEVPAAAAEFVSQRARSAIAAIISLAGLNRSYDGF